MQKHCLHLLAILLLSLCATAQQPKHFTRADTLRGSLTPERLWWNVLRYDLTIKPDYLAKTTAGSNLITYKVVSNGPATKLQLDLQEPLHIDSILLDGKAHINFTRDGKVWYADMPAQKQGSTHKLQVMFSGTPHEAIRPPWDGGWSFTKDSLGRPWMTVTCQGLGASIWYPCKDHQSDEADNGASLTMIVPDTLVAVAMGRLDYKKINGDGTATYKWSVKNPISNYCIIPYIGKYVHFKETYNGEKGKLDLNYWALDYNETIARAYMPDQVHKMLKAFEYWFGPYPFYEDGYKLVETSNTGMEHQSAVSYGNYYKFGYRGRDASGYGWGLKFDFIIVHESGHEWFGNNITTNDLADMWVHEGFTNYSETLYCDYIFGKQAGNEYNYGIRTGIRNKEPIIPAYNVNAQGSGDMYPKAGNMLHTIRHSINNDTAFRKILRGLNKTFYHQTATTQQIENYVSKMAGFDYSKIFDQYLRTTQIPVLELLYNDDSSKISFRYSNCVKGFNLPLSLVNGKTVLKIQPAETWQEIAVAANDRKLFSTDAIAKMYYVKPAVVSSR